MMRHCEIVDLVEAAVNSCLESTYEDGNTFKVIIFESRAQVQDEVNVDDICFTFNPVFNTKNQIISICMHEEGNFKRSGDTLIIEYGTKMLTNLFTTLIYKRLSMVRKENKKLEKNRRKRK